MKTLIAAMAMALPCVALSSHAFAGDNEVLTDNFNKPADDLTISGINTTNTTLDIVAKNVVLNTGFSSVQGDANTLNLKADSLKLNQPFVTPITLTNINLNVTNTLSLAESMCAFKAEDKAGSISYHIKAGKIETPEDNFKSLVYFTDHASASTDLEAEFDVRSPIIFDHGRENVAPDHHHTIIFHNKSRIGFKGDDSFMSVAADNTRIEIKPADKEASLTLYGVIFFSYGVTGVKTTIHLGKQGTWNGYTSNLDNPVDLDLGEAGTWNVTQGYGTVNVSGTGTIIAPVYNTSLHMNFANAKHVDMTIKPYPDGTQIPWVENWKGKVDLSIDTSNLDKTDPSTQYWVVRTAKGENPFGANGSIAVLDDPEAFESKGWMVHYVDGGNNLEKAYITYGDKAQPTVLRGEVSDKLSLDNSTLAFVTSSLYLDQQHGIQNGFWFDANYDHLKVSGQKTNTYRFNTGYGYGFDIKGMRNVVGVNLRHGQAKASGLANASLKSTYWGGEVGDILWLPNQKAFIQATLGVGQERLKFNNTLANNAYEASVHRMHYSAGLGTGYALALSQSLTLTPSVDIQYHRFAGFDYTMGKTHFKTQAANVVLSRWGAKLDWKVNDKLTPFAAVDYFWVMNGKNKTTATNGQQQLFNSTKYQDWGKVLAGLEFAATPALTMKLQANTTFGQARSQSYGVGAQLSYLF